MTRILESFWRALVDSFRPRIIALSLLPLGLIIAASLLLGYLYWDSATAAMAAWMEGSSIWGWFDARLVELGFANATAFFAQLLVVMLVTPLLIVLSLLLVSLFMTPMMAKDVAQRRFPGLQRRGGNQFFQSLGWSLLSTVMACMALLATLVLWLIPPLALVLPPLIWGWLAYRILSFDALAQYASPAERRQIMARQRWPLLLIGVLCGFLSAAPSVLWASGLIFAVAFVVLIPLAVWLFTWVFALTSLWYAHYCLEVLAAWRGPMASMAPPAPAPRPGPVLPRPAQPPAAPALASAGDAAADTVADAAPAEGAGSSAPVTDAAAAAPEPSANARPDAGGAPAPQPAQGDADAALRPAQPAPPAPQETQASASAQPAAEPAPAPAAEPGPEPDPPSALASA
ncbi:MAG: EI24 domain-containing protein [Comamonadaceae bacterium]|nr:EI24 domain-containing protein [Comamonadaceae bacterium]